MRLVIELVPPATYDRLDKITSAPEPDKPTDSVSVRPACVSVALVAVPVASIVSSEIAPAVTTPPEFDMLGTECVARAVAPARITKELVPHPLTIASAIWLRAAVFNDGILCPPL